MKKIVLTISVISFLFITSLSFACSDRFCQELQAKAGVSLKIEQMDNYWSNQFINSANNHSFATQSIEAKGYASSGAESTFDATAVQARFNQNEYQLGNNNVFLGNISLMESEASGTATEKCRLDFKSMAGQYSNSRLIELPNGISTSLNMGTNASVSGTGKNLSFDGNYQQASGIYSQNPNGFSLTLGKTSVKINK